MIFTCRWVVDGWMDEYSIAMHLLWKGGTSGMALYVYYVRLKSSALLIGLPCKSLEDRINCKLYNKTMNKRRVLGCWVRADKIVRH